jgi:predicted nucleic acid-binding protein
MATKVAASDPQRLASSRPPRTFFDSNILIYAEDAAYPAKQKKAIALVLEHRRQRTGVLSTQVLGEFFEVATRRMKMDPTIARVQAEFYSRFELIAPVLADAFAAMDLHRLHRYSYWDSLMIRCALGSGCKVLLSEDMQHGQSIDGVRIVNPFL